MPLKSFIGFFMNIDKNLILLIQQYGFFAYPLLFLVIFLETGLVVTPFLPGDSLLFAAGALASSHALSIFLLFIILCSAAILGDSANYFIGKFIGKKIIEKNWVKAEHVQKTQAFYSKYGGKTIILARFIPIIRTFAPFIAGIGSMNYSRFLAYNIFGGLLWVSIFLFSGFYFGSIPFVKNNFEIVILAIILLSLIPIAIELLKNRIKAKSQSPLNEHIPQA